jgi:calcium-dependent protein kinase
VVREAVLMTSAEKHKSKLNIGLNQPTPQGVHFAVKSITKRKLKDELPLLKRELEILQSVDHPNIIKLYETYEDAKYVHIVMEMCTGGNLMERIFTHDGLYAEEEATIIMKKLLRALSHIHRLYICHRDLKPENLLYATPGEEAEIKISDFGVSKKYEADDLKTRIGTPSYIAPEILKGRYGKECDVWSLGVILYNLLSGRQPFSGASLDEIFQRILEGNYSLNVSELDDVSLEGLDLIRSMLITDPAQRITVDGALSHHWFTLKHPVRARQVSAQVMSALRSKHSHNKFKREVMKVMIKHLSSEQIRGLQDAFAAFDTDNSGTLTSSSLSHALQSLGMNLPSEEIESDD